MNMQNKGLSVSTWYEQSLSLACWIMAALFPLSVQSIFSIFFPGAFTVGNKVIDGIFNFLVFFKTLLFPQEFQLIMSIIDSSVVHQSEIIFTFSLPPFWPSYTIAHHILCYALIICCRSHSNQLALWTEITTWWMSEPMLMGIQRRTVNFYTEHKTLLGRWYT